MKIVFICFISIFITSCTTTDIYGHKQLSIFGWLLLIGFIIFCFSKGFQVAKRNKKQALLIETQRKRIEEIRQNATEFVISDDDRMYIAIYENDKILKLSSRDQELKFDDILWIELKIDNNIIAQQSNEAAIERAITNGMLINKSGYTQCTKSSVVSQQINRIDIVIGQKNSANPIISFLCYLRISQFQEDPNMALRFAQDATNMISALLVRLEAEENSAPISIKNNTNKGYNELVRAKELMDAGILTSEEFNDLKKNILGI